MRKGQRRGGCGRKLRFRSVSGRRPKPWRPSGTPWRICSSWKSNRRELLQQVQPQPWQPPKSFFALASFVVCYT